MAWQNVQMQALIPLINELQDAFSSLCLPLTFDLPQIAVVGAQSSGKSSVLENFVGRDFLPRGTGIVTRRPLILQLVHDSSEEDYGEFNHKKGVKFSNFDTIRTEIEEETNRVCGENKGVMPEPINLKIHSPNVLNLTVIDLPGLTKVAVGDQPSDIGDQIEKMVEQFIKNENCLILAITPANSDLATSDALRLAKKFDPNLTRTIGVLTKLDLMDPGTDAREILQNKLYTLTRGYVGVVNRGQRDIDKNKDIKSALEAERQFFLSHPSYKDMADSMGTTHLQKVLNQELTNHIRETMPSLRDRLKKQLTTLEQEVNDIEKFKADDAKGKNKALVKIVHQFMGDFQRCLENTSGNQIDLRELCAGAKISKIFQERLPYLIEMASSQAEDREMRKEIEMAIKNTKGIKANFFISDKAIEAVAKTQIRQLKEPAIECVDLVVHEIIQIFHAITSSMVRYPNLKIKVEEIVADALREAENDAKKQLTLLNNCELSYMNARHEDFYKNTAPAAQNKKALGDLVIRKGSLSLHNVKWLRGGPKDYWFVLTSENISWYEDNKEKDKKFSLPLDGLQFKSLHTAGVFHSDRRFALFYPSNSNPIYKGQKQLELSTATHDDVEGWKASFHKAGVVPARSAVPMPFVSDPGTPDPELQRDVETVVHLVESYVRIVRKNVCDQVPKVIMFMVVQHMNEYIHEELLPILQSSDEQEWLMEESAEEQKRRQDTVSLYSACKEALGIIANVNMHTVSTPAPPPMRTDWIKESDQDCVPHLTVNDRPPSSASGQTASGSGSVASGSASPQVPPRKTKNSEGK